MAPPTASHSAGLRVDDAIENALLTVVGPGAIAAATAAEKEAGQRRRDRCAEGPSAGGPERAARYAADGAFRNNDGCRSQSQSGLVAGNWQARLETGRSRSERESGPRSRGTWMQPMGPVFAGHGPLRGSAYCVRCVR